MTRFLIVFTASLGLLVAPVAHSDPEAPNPPPDPISAVQVANESPAPLSLQDVVAANPEVKNPNLIFPGQLITLPGRDPHTVLAGETLNGIIGGPPQVAPPQPASSPAVSPAPDGGTPVPGPSVPVHQSVNWDRVAACESGGNWSINTGNSFYGGLQFTMSTWHSNGGTGSPQGASREEQIRVAENVLHTQGIGAWPTCGKRG